TPGDGEKVCIKGGFTLLGDPNLDGFIDGINFRVSSAPIRPVLVSPFLLDRTEFTVGRLKALVERGLKMDDPPDAHREGDVPNYCNWEGPDDDMPVNCVPLATARQICQFDQGDIPHEAQWEHAARGRGQRRSYPWGNTAPECCSAAIFRGGSGTCGSV